MVVDELQSMNPLKKTKMAAATAACRAKTFNDQLPASYETDSLMTG
jgi:hypothetical protein